MLSFLVMGRLSHGELFTSFHSFEYLSHQSRVGCLLFVTVIQFPPVGGFVALISALGRWRGRGACRAISSLTSLGDSFITRVFILASHRVI